MELAQHAHTPSSGIFGKVLPSLLPLLIAEDEAECQDDNNDKKKGEHYTTHNCHCHDHMAEISTAPTCGQKVGGQRPQRRKGEIALTGS